MFLKDKTLIIAFATVLFGFTACKKDKSDPTDHTPTEKTYSLLVSAGTPEASYLVQTGSLTEGTISTANNGVSTTLSIFTSRDGYYYAIDYSSTSLVKFTSDNKINTIIKETPFTQISWAGYSGFYAWKDSKTLLLFNANAGLQFEYAALDVETMTITKSGNINIPVPTGEDNYWGNSVVFVGNKLYISYCKELKATDLPEKAYVASINYPDMDNVTIDSDERFNYPSPYNLSTPGALSYNGSAYFLTSPTFWASGNINSPYGIYRVLNGGTQIDDSYFYELTDRDKEETIGLWDLGNGKAITKVLNKTLITENADYSAKNAANYYVVDLVNETKSKINIPISRDGSYGSNVLIDDDKAYIVTNTGDGFYVYEFDPVTSAVKKGLKLEGVSAIRRIERIK